VGVKDEGKLGEEAAEYKSKVLAMNAELRKIMRELELNGKELQRQTGAIAEARKQRRQAQSDVEKSQSQLDHVDQDGLTPRQRDAYMNSLQQDENALMSIDGQIQKRTEKQKMLLALQQQYHSRLQELKKDIGTFMNLYNQRESACGYRFASKVNSIVLRMNDEDEFNTPTSTTPTGSSDVSSPSLSSNEPSDRLSVPQHIEESFLLIPSWKYARYPSIPFLHGDSAVTPSSTFSQTSTSSSGTVSQYWVASVSYLKHRRKAMQCCTGGTFKTVELPYQMPSSVPQLQYTDVMLSVRIQKFDFTFPELLLGRVKRSVCPPDNVMSFTPISKHISFSSTSSHPSQTPASTDISMTALLQCMSKFTFVESNYGVNVGKLFMMCKCMCLFSGMLDHVRGVGPHAHGDEAQIWGGEDDHIELTRGKQENFASAPSIPAHRN
ncbi:hypothetical protein ADUPG1_000688, partial [Aduncisulcus paluster]